MRSRKAYTRNVCYAVNLQTVYGKIAIRGIVIVLGAIATARFTHACVHACSRVKSREARNVRPLVSLSEGVGPFRDRKKTVGRSGPAGPPVYTRIYRKKRNARNRYFAYNREVFLASALAPAIYRSRNSAGRYPVAKVAIAPPPPRLVSPITIVRCRRFVAIIPRRCCRRNRQTDRQTDRSPNRGMHVRPRG